GAGPLVRRWPGALGPVPGLVWVAQEALRDRTPFGGFPWARLAFSQQDSPLVRLAAAGGAPLVTFGVGLAGGLLAAGLLVGVSLRTHPALDRARPRLAIVAGARPPLVVVLAGVGLAGGGRCRRLPAPPAAGRYASRSYRGMCPGWGWSSTHSANRYCVTTSPGPRTWPTG